MALEDYNVCPEHGTLEPEGIMIGGPTGGIPFCIECGANLRTQAAIDAEAMMNEIIEGAYGEPS